MRSYKSDISQGSDAKMNRKFIAEVDYSIMSRVNAELSKIGIFIPSTLTYIHFSKHYFIMSKK